MNRVAQCIRMLMILRTRQKASTKELAELLDTNPRNIREYRRELEEAGYTIQEIRGRNGGYSIQYSDILPVPKLTKDEEQILTSGMEYVESQHAFVKRQEFSAILSKIIYESSASGTSSFDRMTYRTNPMKDLTPEETEMLETAQKAIEEKVSLILNYQGRDKNKPSKVMVDPYKVIFIGGSFYLIGWSHSARDYRNYRFSSYRMLELEKTNKSFITDSYFRLENYIGSASAFKGKVFVYEVQVKEQTTRIFEEMYWGSDFKKLHIKDGWQSYSFCSDNQPYVFENLFKLKDDVKLTAPDSAVEAFIEQTKSILSVYSKETE